VASTFSASDGEAYERTMGRWANRLAEPFLDFAGSAAGERVLDVGCGTGSLSFALAKRTNVVEICGLDFSAVYADHAKARCRDDRISFHVGDACAMPFPDRSFDRVLSQLMLHFVPDAKSAVAEMRRVARPGAVVAATVWDARGGFVANRIVWDTAAVLDPKVNELRARNYTRPMTRPGELAAAWRDAGLADVLQTMLIVRMDYASFDDFWEPYLDGQGPIGSYIGNLSSVARDQLRGAVRQAYVDGEADGARSYAAVAWAVRGTAPH
jgi:SAM-dependent methyltransferase